MNFLAHLYLAGENEDYIVGQVLADFLERGWQQRVSDGVLRGIRLHQQADLFTDQHECFRRSRARLPQHLRRYAGIVVDIFYDHLLATHWGRFHDAPLDRFAQSRYRILQGRTEEMTDRMRLVLPSMVEHDWLTSYRKVEGMERALAGVSRRLKRANPIAEAGAALSNDQEGFERDFLEFFPDLAAHISRLAKSTPAA
ncbi:MAG: acyl carrier protein phosphodiesterase [Acidobacteria bacterium]|nr:acyl carrier protein phosphodiesterase [Acidobacteriota bacterium]MDA1236418.1 acyl carrier protein phosphodiesterase [Acidobacteriota bacterium]